MPPTRRGWGYAEGEVAHWGNADAATSLPVARPLRTSGFYSLSKRKEVRQVKLHSTTCRNLCSDPQVPEAAPVRIQASGWSEAC